MPDQQNNPKPLPLLDDFVSFRFGEIEKDIHELREDFKRMMDVYSEFRTEAEAFRIAVSERLARLEIILILVAPFVSSIMAWALNHFVR